MLKKIKKQGVLLISDTNKMNKTDHRKKILIILLKEDMSFYNSQGIEVKQ